VPEHFIGGPVEKNRILCELDSFRENPIPHVREAHPELRFVTLGELALLPQYSSRVHQSLLVDSLKALATKLRTYSSDINPLSPHRVWVGIEPAKNASALSIGGFHYANLGYRYIQEISVLTLAGPGLGLGEDLEIDSTLATLELLRGYVHDTMHYNSFRSYQMLPSEVAGSSSNPSFYRVQYGINFRRSSGATYSLRDRADSASTRNLGIIMEAAVDRFAQDLVAELAASHGYQPPSSPFPQFVFRDCTGQLRQEDLLQLREVAGSDDPSHEVQYLRAMYSFYREITERYERFLAEFDPLGENGLHERIMSGIVTGKIRPLVKYFDHRSEGKRQFVQLFKSDMY
jgi:hypothetical protein